MISEKKQINQGNNLELALAVKGESPESLAYKLNMDLDQLLELQKSQTIDDEILKKISLALDIPVDFFKSFNRESTQSYNVYDNDIKMSHAENSNGQNNVQKLVGNENNHFSSLREISLLQEKIFSQTEENAILKHKLEQSEKK